MTTWRSAMAWIGMAAIGLSLTGCKDKPSQAAEPPPRPSVDVVTLHARPVVLTTELPGRTSAFRTAEVRPQVNGIILKRLFTEGDTVQAGQQLYQIDPAPYEAALASAQATLLHAQASVKVAQSVVSRYRRWPPRSRSAGRTWTTPWARWSRTRRTSRPPERRSRPRKSIWRTPRCCRR